MSDCYRDLGVGVPDPWTGFASPVWIAAGLAADAVARCSPRPSSAATCTRSAATPRRRACRASGFGACEPPGFVIIALCAGVGAVVTTARTASSIPNTGATLLLPAFAAAFLGAAMSRRNQFNIGGTVVGVLFLQVVADRADVHGLRAGRAEHRPGRDPRRGDPDQPPRCGAAVTLDGRRRQPSHAAVRRARAGSPRSIPACSPSTTSTSTFDDQQVVGLVGKNGAGKSTLIKMHGRRRSAPTAGQVARRRPRGRASTSHTSPRTPGSRSFTRTSRTCPSSPSPRT